MSLFTIWELFSFGDSSLPEENSSLGVIDTLGVGQIPSGDILTLAF